MTPFKLSNNKKGVALVTALVVFVVLFVLGIGILGVSSNEAKLTGRQYSRTQAYYSARSGVEVAVQQIEGIVNASLYDEVAALYAAINAPFSGSVVSGQDTYAVSFVDGGLVADDKIKILGQATRNGVQASTALTLHFTTPNFIPLDWLNPGQIIKRGTWERTVSPVVVKTAKLLGHSPKKSTTADTIWKSPAIHFVDNDGGFSFEITAKSMEFQTNILSFRHKILTSANKLSDDAFVLKTFNAEGFRDAAGNRLWLTNSVLIEEGWGVLVLKEDIVTGNKNNYSTFLKGDNGIGVDGYYAFKPGTQLMDDAQRVVDGPNLKKITNGVTKDYIDEVIRRDTGLQMVPSDQIWSQD